MKLITNKRDSNGLTNKDFFTYLKNPVVKTEMTTAEMDELKLQLEAALKIYPGLGISATQIGIKKRVCLIKLEPYDYELFLVNPIVTERSEELFLFYEGCLSIPKTIKELIPTIRHQKIVVQTDNLGTLTFEVDKEADKKDNRVSLETMKTVIVQHEIDHLDGFTILDRKWVPVPPATKSVKYERNDIVVMKTPSGELVQVKYKHANDYFLKGYELV